MQNIKAYIFIYLLPPLITLGFFLLITRNLKTKDDANTPYLSIATTHFHFCLAFMLLANAIMGQWRAIENTALLYFFLLSPILAIFIGLKNFLLRQKSPTHYWLFTSSINYIIIYSFSLLAIIQSS